MMTRYLQDLERLGHCLLPSVLDEQSLTVCRDSIQRILDDGEEGVLSSRQLGYGIRNLLDLWPDVVQLTQHASIQELIKSVLGEQAGAVRCLFFDKPPGRSWTLPWHRDLTIAVEEPNSDLGQFRNVTKKAGIYHVNAPASFLKNMLTLRFALDPMTEENGPLIVQSGAHWPVDEGREDGDRGSEEGDSQTEGKPYTTILGQAGDVFVMRPLLPHSSLKSVEGTPLRRRIIHLELSNVRQLPAGLEWHCFEPLF